MHLTHGEDHQSIILPYEGDMGEGDKDHTSNMVCLSASLWRLKCGSHGECKRWMEDDERGMVGGEDDGDEEDVEESDKGMKEEG